MKCLRIVTQADSCRGYVAFDLSEDQINDLKAVAEKTAEIPFLHSGQGVFMPLTMVEVVAWDGFILNWSSETKELRQPTVIHVIPTYFRITQQAGGVEQSTYPCPMLMLDTAEEIIFIGDDENELRAMYNADH